MSALLLRPLETLQVLTAMENQKLEFGCMCMLIVILIEFYIPRSSDIFFFMVDSAEDLVPEIIDKVAVPALIVVVEAVAAVLEVVTAATEDLVEVILIFPFWNFGKRLF